MKQKDQVDEFNSKYPQKDYSKFSYSFTGEETRKLQTLDTISQLGKMSDMMINQVIQGECLPRVAIKNSPDVGILYDLPRQQFVVFVPKNLCAQCKKRKATLEYKEKGYCEDCIDLVKTIEAGKGKVK